MAYTKLVPIGNQVSQALPKPQHNVEFHERIKEALLKTPDMTWIEVSLAEQVLYLYKGSQIQEAYRVSTGRPGSPFRKSMATRKGCYNIYYMKASYPMWGRDWWCPDVPYAIFFHGELAIHGAFWHNDFGTPVSHGCVNMMPDDAKRIYEQVKKKGFVWVH